MSSIDLDFPEKKNYNPLVPLVEDINGKFQGVEFKSLGCQGITPKFEGKSGFTELQGVMVK